jgi:hypothetical protein
MNTAWGSIGHQTRSSVFAFGTQYASNNKTKFDHDQTLDGPTSAGAVNSNAKEYPKGRSGSSCLFWPQKTGVPEEVEFKTKPQIALEQLCWACSARLPRRVAIWLQKK